MIGIGCCTGLGDGVDLSSLATSIGADPSLMNQPMNNTLSLPPSGSTDWASAIANIFKPITNMFATRYSVPQLNPGQMIQTGPYGTVMSQSGNGIPGTSQFSAFGPGFGVQGSSGLFLMGGAVLLILLMEHR